MHIVEAIFIDKALGQAMTKKLHYPLRSSIVRGGLSNASKAGAVLSLSVFIYAETMCLMEEVECAGL